MLNPPVVQLEGGIGMNKLLGIAVLAASLLAALFAAAQNPSKPIPP